MTDCDEQISVLAKRLKLPIFNKYSEFIKHGAAFNENLAALLTEEAARRSNATVQRKIKQAGFPIRKTIDTFKNRLPRLTPDIVAELATCKFIEARTNVCALGPSGVGKSHLMTAIAMEAIAKGYTVRFYRVNDLLLRLNEAKSEKQLDALNTALKNCNLLCMDELGYVNVSSKNADLLFNVVASRHEVGSTYITSNYEFSRWSGFLGNQVMTAALVEKLTQNIVILNMNGEPYRPDKK
jgi:DNA replication protein DnaC